MNRNDKGSGKYPLPLSFLFLYQVLQVLIVGDALQLVLDNQLDILLDLVVIVQNSLLHAVVAIGILEVVNDRDRLIMAFLSFYLVGVNDNLGMEDLLLYALGEVIGNRADKHTLLCSGEHKNPPPDGLGECLSNSGLRTCGEPCRSGAKLRP